VFAWKITERRTKEKEKANTDACPYG